MRKQLAWFSRKMNEWGAKGRPFLFMIDFEQKKPVLLLLDEIDPDFLKYNFQGKTNDFSSETPVLAPIEPTFISPQKYQTAFEKVQTGLRLGNSFLVNLTFPTEISLSGTLEQVYHATTAKYRLYLNNEWVFFSPETFVQIKDGRIYAFPMKGTLPSTIPIQVLMDNPKEKAEHATIVDLIRNDLSEVAKSVRVDRYRYYEEIQTSRSALWQTSSQISGDLPKDFRNQLGDILLRLLPAGSISGAPKASTIRIIQAAERQERAYYTGVAALWDGQELDSCVLIRCIEKQENNYRYWSGGGITVNSNWKEEYKELKEKVYLPVKSRIETIRAQ